MNNKIMDMETVNKGIELAFWMKEKPELFKSWVRLEAAKMNYEDKKKLRQDTKLELRQFQIARAMFELKRKQI